MAGKILGQDIVVLAKLISNGSERQTGVRLAASLSLSPSQVHEAQERLRRAGLTTPWGRPSGLAAFEFFIFGVKYCFPAQPGPLARGVPTAHAAMPLRGLFSQRAELPPVWPAAEDRPGRTLRGTPAAVNGIALEPVHRSGPPASARDRRVYEFLALIDAFRQPHPFYQRFAERELAVRLGVKTKRYAPRLLNIVPTADQQR